MKNCHVKTPEQSLTESGYKLSAPRTLVLSLLKKAHGPLSAQEMARKIKSINLASIYRTLHILEELELVNCETLGIEKKYCLAKEAHHHIVCIKCGHLEEVKCTHSFADIKNFTNIKHQLTLSGLCKKCSR